MADPRAMVDEVMAKENAMMTQSIQYEISMRQSQQVTPGRWLA